MFYLVIWFLILTFFILFVSYLSKKEKTSIYLIVSYSSLVLIANIFSVKLLEISSNIIVPAGIIVYSLTFLITDVLGEVFGKKEAKKAIKSGLLINLLFIFLSYLISLFSYPISNKDMALALEKVLSFTPKIIIASIVAYLVSQYFDVIVFHQLKKIMKGKYLWLRNNVSTMISQLIDTIVFITIAFFGVFGKEMIIKMIISQYLIKWLIALFDTPFIYLSVKILKSKNQNN